MIDENGFLPENLTHEQPGSLELSQEEFRKLGYRAVDMMADYLATIRERRVYTPMPYSQRQELLQQALPQNGTAPEEIFRKFAEQILPYPMGNGHPRFFGWVNSPPAPIGVLAEFMAAAFNPSCAGGNHAAVYLEYCVTRWLMELVGFPVEGSMGILVSGGSMASLTCLAAARQRAFQLLGEDVRATGLQTGSQPKLVMYLSSEGHSCLRKAVELMGLGSNSLHFVKVDSTYRIDISALREAIEADLTAGFQPFCVAASAGTVNTGAIDPLDEIADICAQYNLWFHVDGAYGAVGILDSRAKPHYKGLERADSLALDPHKWLCVPVECGCALVRDSSLLRDTFSLVPPYLRTEEGRGIGGLPWFSEYGFQQSRGFRALKLWMSLLQTGRQGLETMVSYHNSLALYLASQIEAAPNLQLLAPVTLSIVCFRYIPAEFEGSEEVLNTLNKTIMEEVQAGGDSFITSTVVDGRYALRACIVHYATLQQDLDALVKVVQATGQRLAT